MFIDYLIVFLLLQDCQGAYGMLPKTDSTQTRNSSLCSKILGPVSPLDMLASSLTAAISPYAVPQAPWSRSLGLGFRVQGLGS